MASDRDATTTGGGSPTEAITSRQFTQVRRGFDQGEVRRFQAELADEVQRLRARGDDLAERLARAEADVARPEVSEEAVVAAVGDEMATILRSAHGAASDLRARAAAEANAVVTEANSKAEAARSEADEHRAQAEAESESRLASAHSEAEALIARAVEEAEGILEAARHNAAAESAQVIAKSRADGESYRQQAEQDRRLTIEGAQAIRERILTDLARRRRVATVQIEQLRAGRERLLESYGVVRRTLEEVQDELQRADAEARAAADDAGRRLEADPGEPTLSALPAVPPAFHPATPPPVPVETGLQDSSPVEAGLEPTDPVDVGLANTGPDDTGVEHVDPDDASVEHVDPDDSGVELAEPDDPGPEDTGPVDTGPGDSGLDAANPGAPDLDATDPVETGLDDPASSDPGLDDTDPVDIGLTDPGPGAGHDPAPGLPVGPDPAEGAPPGPVEQSAPAVGAASSDPAGLVAPAAPVQVTATVAAVAAAGISEAPAAVEAGTPTVSTAPGLTLGGPVSVTQPDRVRLVRVGRMLPATPPIAGAAPLTSSGGGGLRVVAGAAAALAAEPVVEEAGLTPPTANLELVADDDGDGADAVGTLFDRIRAGRERSVAEARRVLGAPVPAVETPTPIDDEGPGSDREGADDADPHEVRSEADESELQRRDGQLEEMLTGLTRRLKRALQDEHNDLLDRLRGVRGAPTLAAALGDHDEQTARYATAAEPFVRRAATAGAAPTSQPAVDGADVAIDAITTRATAAVAAAIVEPIRRRIEAVLAERGGDAGEALVDALASVYRETRSQRIEPLAVDTLTAVHSEAGWTVAPEGTTFRWIAEDGGGPCPDCDDNVLAGPVTKGEEFPTGQLYPPAHQGCHCLLVAVPA